MSKITRNGRYHVLRNNDGTPFARTMETVPSKAWRQLLRDATDNGQELLTILLDIARGEPVGPQKEPANTAQRMEAATKLWEYLHGKAVPQTDVVHAEEESRLLERYMAMDERELRRIANQGQIPQDVPEDAEFVPVTIDDLPNKND